MNVIELRSVTKRFNEFVAVRDLSFAVRQGSVFGLLGPNGAGKTTTISIICGIVRPDSGNFQVDGQPITSDTSPAKRAIGYVPQDLALYEELSATDNLRLFGSLYSLYGEDLRQRMTSALALTGLSDRATEPVRRFSGGMKRRLNIAAALLHDPQLIILDEPTVGVDPQSRNAIFDTLKSLQQSGKTILYTTHYMEEVERLCDRIAIMDHGKIIAIDTLPSLRRLLPAEDRLEVELADGLNGTPLHELSALGGVRQAHLEGRTLIVDLQQIGQDVPAVLGWLNDRKIAIRAVSTKHVALEDVFLHLTGRSLRD